MKKIFKWLMVVVLFFLPVMSYAETNKAVQEARNGVVRVLTLYFDENGNTVGYATGSGFAIGKAGESVNYFITNNHVVCDNPYYVYIILDKMFDATGTFQGIHVEVEKCWETPDIAILRAPKPITERSAQPLLSAETLGVTQPVFALGFPGIADEASDNGANLPSSIDEVTVTTGTVTKTKTSVYGADCIQIDANINHGNSGGPLVDEKGNVVGINTYGAEGANYSTYIDYVIQYLEDHQLPYYSAGQKNMSAAQGLPLIAIVGVGAVVVVIVVLLFRGNKQVAIAGPLPPVQQDYPIQPQPVMVQTVQLIGMSGVYAGQRFSLSGSLMMGRDPRRCQIIFPSQTAGVSGLHCEVRKAGGGIELIDRGSTYGTYLKDGTKLEINCTYTLQSGDEFYLGSRENNFKVE